MKTLSFKNLTLLFLFFIFSANQIFAQILDNSIYNRGQYYDLEGVKHTGFINFSFNAVGTPRIRFKTDSLGTDDQRIEIKTIKSVVIYYKVTEEKSDQKDTNTVKLPKQPKILADSFVVINETIDNPQNPLKTRLALFLVEGVNAKIYSREAERNVSTPGAMSGFSIGFSYQYTKTFYMCEISGKVFELNRDNFKELLYVAFSDDQELLEKINKKKYRFGDLRTIIDEYIKFKNH